MKNLALALTAFASVLALTKAAPALAAAPASVPAKSAVASKPATPVSAARAPAPTAAPAPVSPVAARPVFSVVPGGSGSPLGAAPRGGTPQLVWTGFQVTEEGSRVFVQTTAEVELKVVPAKGGVTLTLHNCRVHMRNNSRTLDTRFFVTPIERIAVRQHRRDIELNIALREPAQSTPRREDGPAGTHFWVVDFAPPVKSAAAAPARAGSVSLK